MKQTICSTHFISVSFLYVTCVGYITLSSITSNIEHETAWKQIYDYYDSVTRTPTQPKPTHTEGKSIDININLSGNDAKNNDYLFLSIPCICIIIQNDDRCSHTDMVFLLSLLLVIKEWIRHTILVYLVVDSTNTNIIIIWTRKFYRIFFMCVRFLYT